MVLNELEKPKFDAHLEGTLLDSEKNVIPTIFNRGRSLLQFKKDQFYIQVDPHYSEIGKLRDKLSTIVNNSTPLFVASEKLISLLEEIAPRDIEFYNLIIEEEMNNHLN